jgi:hypothetical protein
LFLEDVGEKPYRIERMLTHLKMAGKMDKLAGLVFGDLTNCEGEGPRDVGQVIAEPVEGSDAEPVVATLDGIAHLDDQSIIVRHEGEQAVADAVPEVEHAVRSTQETATEHGVRAAVDDRHHQAGQIERIVLEIRVLDHDDVAGGGLDPACNCGPLAAVVGLEEEHVDPALLLQAR